jgi:hypothetical protein
MRKKAGTRRLIAAVMAILAATSIAAQKVSYDYDKRIDFTKFKTFTFKDGTKSNDPLVDRRVVAAIVSALIARGMTRDDSMPDVVVVTHLTFDKRKDISAWSTAPAYGPYGWAWGDGWHSTHVRVHDILAGTLVIDVVDVATGTIAWRGIGEKEVKQDPTQELLDKNVDRAVMRVLRNFPPGTGSRHS